MSVLQCGAGRHVTPTPCPNPVQHVLAYDDGKKLPLCEMHGEFIHQVQEDLALLFSDDEDTQSS